MIVLISEIQMTRCKLPGGNLVWVPEGGTAVKEWRLQQRCAAAMFVPFFPLGQYWELRMEGNRNWYRAPEELVPSLQALAGNPGAPWYSWTGTALTVVALILLLAGVIG